MAGYIRQSSFVDGDTITAALFNDEYNQLVNAFSNTNGHKHDGTTAEGPVIGLIGDAGETSPNNKVLIDTTNNYIEFYIEVASAPVQQLYIADGAIVPVTDNDIDLGTSSLEFKNLYLDGIAKIDTLTVDEAATIGTTLGVTGATTLSSTLGVTGATTLSSTLAVTGATTLSSTLAVTGTSTLTGNVTTTNDLTVGGNLTVTGNATISGNLTFGDADTDSINLAAEIDSDIIPNTDGTYDLGSATKEWQDLYIDGTANIDSLVADTADINAGTIDNTVIGGTTAVAGSFTTATATTGNITTVNSTTVDTTNIEVTNIKAKDGTSAGSIADSTGVVTLASSVLTTTDINGGTIDNTAIGGTTASTGAFTTLSASGATTLSSTLGVTGAATFNGNVTVGDAATDTLTITADVASNVIPSADSTYTLGDSSNYWSHGYIDAITTTGNVVVGGNITVNGTTTTVNSTTVTIDDPVMTIGGDTAPSVDDNKDRGIEFRWHNGTAAKVGFFGYDDSASVFTFIPDATNTSEVFSGSAGNVAFGNIAGTLTTAAQPNITSVGTLTGLTTTGDINFGDNDKAVFGAGSDLQIYHDGSNSFIYEGGTGSLKIQAVNLNLQSTTGESYIDAVNNGSVYIYYDNAPKLATTATGIDVTGIAVVDGLTSSAAITSTSNSNSLGGTTFTSAVSGTSLSLSASITASGNSNSLGGTNFTSNIDVTGTVTADGLTVDGGADGSTSYTRFTEYSSGYGFNGAYASYKGSSNELIFGRHNTFDSLTANDIPVMSFARATGDISFYDDTGVSQALFWDASAESLGIGTSSPSTKLHIDHSGNQANAIQVGDLTTIGSNTGIYFRTTGNAYISTASTGNHVFDKAGTEAMRIDSSGNLLVGTTSATYDASNRSNVEIGSSSDSSSILALHNGSNSAYMFFNSTTLQINNTTSTGLIRFDTNGSERIRIDSSGNLLVGKTSTTFSVDGFIARSDGFSTSRTSGTVADINRNGTDGNVFAFYKAASSVGSISVTSSATAYNTSSDARLKDVTGEARGLEVINALNPVAFNWKADGHADEGLLAQEVKEIVPNAVSGSEEEYYQMDYSKLVTHLIAGMKEQQTLIEQLQAEVALLKGE